MSKVSLCILIIPCFSLTWALAALLPAKADLKVKWTRSCQEFTIKHFSVARSGFYCLSEMPQCFYSTISIHTGQVNSQAPGTFRKHNIMHLIGWTQLSSRAQLAGTKTGLPYLCVRVCFPLCYLISKSYIKRWPPVSLLSLLALAVSCIQRWHDTLIGCVYTCTHKHLNTEYSHIPRKKQKSQSAYPRPSTANT